MKINENTRLIGKNLIFVPYKKHHVEKYHKWMQSAELLEKTASEPLSLDQEYKMQQNWWIDEDKCTFILLLKNSLSDQTREHEINSMIGDVNLFFNNIDNKKEAELEVMIAENSMRGQGLGKEAVAVMMYYGYLCLSISMFSVKIGFGNVASIKLFTKLGFTEVSKSNVFQEVTLGLECSANEFQTNIVKVVEPYFKKAFYDP